MNSVKDTSGGLQNKQEKMAEHLEHSPWKGLNYYLEEDQALFFGRDREIQEFVKFIDRDVLTILFATSGIGKTSLLRAGVLPLLRNSGKFPVVVRLLYGEGLPSPQEQFITTLIEEAKKLKVEIEGISEVGISGMGLWEFFHSIECWSPRNDLLTPVIILDQFEEIFTLGKGADEFIDELADLAENRIPINLRRAVEAEEKIISCDPNLQNYKIILALREDYVPKLDLLRSRMPSVMRNRFALQAFDQRAAFEVISRAGGEWIDDTVAEKIVEAVAGENNQDLHGRDKVEPAYLSVMCDELYRRMVLRGESSITKDLVCEEGKDILKDLYARSFEGLDDNVQFFVEDQLLTESGFRATLPVTDAVQKGIKKDELDILVNRRLLRFEDRLGTRHVEMSHDLLTGLALENRNLRKKRIEDAERESQILEYKKRLKKSRYITLASCATVLILLSAVLIVFNCWFLEHKTYFHSVKRIYGQPRGIGKPLSEKAVRHRQTSYEITTQGRRIWFIGPLNPTVISLRAIDSHFNLTTQHDMETYLYSSKEAPIDEKTEQTFFGANDKTAQRDLSEEDLQSVCQWEFFSGKNGRPIYEIGKNGTGDIVWRLIYAPSDLYDWKKQVVAHFTNKSGYPQKQRQDEADYVQISYDERGFEKLIEYRDSNGQRVSGRDGAHALERAYDSQGRLVILQSMSWSEDNQKYERMIDRCGNCGTRCSYNESGLLESCQSFGLAGEPCPIKGGVVSDKNRYDSWGNLIERSFWDQKDRPAAAVDLTDIHKIKYAYESGCITEEAYYGVNKELKTIEQGYAIIRMKYDNEGNQIEWACFNDRDQPCLDLSSGTHLTRRIFDDKGRVKDERYFGISNKKPCENKYGNHGFLLKYNDHGKLEEQIYLGINGKPKENEYGYAIERMEYDDSGNQIKWACFDADNYPSLNTSDETHMTRRVFNSNGMVVKERYFGTYWQPIENKNGEFGWTAEYDGQGNRISTVYLGPDGITPKNKESGNYSGIAVVKNRFNKQNFTVEQRYFNDQGEPTLNSNGVHYGTISYTESGKMMELAAYDLKDSRVVFEGERVAMKRWHYDFKTGKESEILFYGVDGRLTTCDDGYAIIRMKYDNKGNQIEWVCFNEQDQPCLNLSSGTHITRNIFDDKGRVKDERCFGVDREPCEDKNGTHGFLYKYDNHGKIEEQISLGVNGKPKENEYGYAIKRMKYDDHGNEIESACFNAQGRPCLNLSDGIHMTRKVFDDQGRAIEQRNYGLSEQPIEDMNGTFGGSCKYDDRGNIIQITFWGPDDKPKEIKTDTSTMMKGTKGVAGINMMYDDQNRLLKMSYLSASGNPCLNSDGVSGAILTYDASGTQDKKMTDISGQECGSDKVVSVTIAHVDSPGFKKGVRSGDIVFSYGRWDWSGTSLTEKDIESFGAACNSEIRPLRVVVYRNGEIIELEFPGGKMGVRVMDTSISNDLFQKVKKSYHRYKAEKTTTK